jgi:hypothetical protein
MVGTEPISSVRSGDGWWVADIDGKLLRIPPLEDESEKSVEMKGGEFIAGNGIDIMVTATQSGLIRWWESAELSSKRRAIIQRLVTEERQRLDWEFRKNMFQEARRAEDDGILSKAIELYQALGRSGDVHRMLQRQSRGD